MEEKELVVLSLAEADVEEWLDGSDLLRAIERRGLMPAVLEKAREYMWSWLDSSDMEADCVAEAARWAVAKCS